MTPANGHSTETRPDLDHAFRALSDTIRRRVLALLVNDTPREQDAIEATVFDADEPDRETFTVALHHSHLPHLDDSGYIDWDPDSGTVARGEQFGDIRPLLELLDDQRAEPSVDGSFERDQQGDAAAH